MSDIKYHQNQGPTVPAEQVHLHVLPTSLHSQVLHLQHVATQKSCHFNVNSCHLQGKTRTRFPTLQSTTEQVLGSDYYGEMTWMFSG